MTDGKILKPEDIASVLEFEVDDENLPEALRPPQDEMEAEGEGKKARAAFGGMRSTLGVSKEIIRQQAAEIEELRKGSRTQSPTQQGEGQAQQVNVEAYELGLKTRALSSLQQSSGITDPDHPMVKREEQRLYEADLRQQQEVLDANANAETIQAEVLSGFKLDDEDHKKVGEKLERLDALSKANPEVIRSVVHMHIGENLNKFAGTKGAGTNGDHETVSDGAAASSMLRAQGSAGVKPGKGIPDADKSVSPAQGEEISGMRRIGLDPSSLSSVAQYRRAKDKVGNYSPAGSSY